MWIFSFQQCPGNATETAIVTTSTTASATATASKAEPGRESQPRQFAYQARMVQIKAKRGSYCNDWTFGPTYGRNNPQSWVERKYSIVQDFTLPIVQCVVKRRRAQPTCSKHVITVKDILHLEEIVRWHLFQGIGTKIRS